MERAPGRLLALVAAAAACVAVALAADTPACPKGTVPIGLVDPQPKKGGMYLQVYAAGSDRVEGARLRDGSSVCPTEYDDGFTVLCKGVAEGVSGVSFSVDGAVVREERMAPYTINGDFGGKSRAWRRYPKAGGVIKCEADNGDYVETKVMFEC